MRNIVLEVDIGDEMPAVLHESRDLGVFLVLVANYYVAMNGLSSPETGVTVTVYRSYLG